MTLDWLVWYYARALELPFPVLRTLLTHGLPTEQVEIDDHIELHVFGQRHCIFGPAVECAGGSKWWYNNGQLHRNDGPAVEWPNGETVWRRNGQLHRVGGPALEDIWGNKWWYRNNKLHCDDGPAIERVNGINEYWRNGVQFWPSDQK